MFQVRRNFEIAPASKRAIPSVHTIAAPVGRSFLNDQYSPAPLASVATIQPTSNRIGNELTRNVALAAGTMRYENTMSTPPTCTKLVTIKPNKA